MERVLSLSTEPICRSTISKNCKHHYFSCYLCWTLSSWNPGLTPRGGFPWSGADEGCSCCCIRKDKGLLRFPFLCQSTSPKSKQLCKKKVPILVNLPKYQTQALLRECLMAHFTRKNTFRIFDRGVSFRQKSLSRFWPFLPNCKRGN